MSGSAKRAESIAARAGDLSALPRTRTWKVWDSVRGLKTTKCEEDQEATARLHLHKAIKLISLAAQYEM